VTRPIDQIPEAVRKANAYRQTFALVLGFDLDRQTFLVLTQVANAPPIQPDEVYVTAVVSRAGDPSEQTDFCAVAGAIPAAWWQAGADLLIRAWNALSQEERHVERLRWVSEYDVLTMATLLLNRGIEPPNLNLAIDIARNLN